MSPAWRLLLVDDSPAECELAREAVAEFAPDFTLVTRENPDAAAAAIDENQPDLVLLDLRLGRWNGRELLSRLRGRQGVIILTTTENPEEERACRAAGARDFWLKPRIFTDYCAFFSRLRELLQGPEPLAC